MTSGRLISLHAAIYFRDIDPIRERFYADCRETELEPEYLMGWAVNNITIKGGLDSILEFIIDVRNYNGEVVSVRYGDNQTYYRC